MGRHLLSQIIYPRDSIINKRKKKYFFFLKNYFYFGLAEPNSFLFRQSPFTIHQTHTKVGVVYFLSKKYGLQALAHTKKIKKKKTKKKISYAALFGPVSRGHPNTRLLFLMACCIFSPGVKQRFGLGGVLLPRDAERSKPIQKNNY